MRAFSAPQPLLASPRARATSRKHARTSALAIRSVAGDRPTANRLLQAGSATSLGCLAALLLACQPSAAASSDVFLGVPRVVDGDTLVVAQQRVRLFGIDAPETKQMCTRPSGSQYACGQESKEALAQKVGGAEVVCRQQAKDLYGRAVAVCSLNRRGDAREDLNAWMVEQGHAVAYRQYSKAYVALEDEARLAKRGIWAGSFQEPAQWRKAQRAAGSTVGGGAAAASAPAAAAAAAAPKPAAVPPSAGPAPAPAPQADCLIKGNITQKGERIYHTPGSRSYEATVIEMDKGERWFCSASEAEAAGWRAARG
eukprot:scaffold10.g2445.t1